MYDGPIRGGTRGGQGDFRWSAVANDKHRENYLGHSINAPVGRWSKNKDIHWYNREVSEDDTAKAARERAEELQRIKQQEEDALAAALGYAVPMRDTDGEGTGSNNIPVRKSEKDDEIARLEKEERKREKALRREQRALKRAEKEIRRGEREKHRHRHSESRRHHHDDEDSPRHYEREHERIRSHRHHDERDEYDRRSPDRERRERDYTSDRYARDYRVKQREDESRQGELRYNNDRGKEKERERYRDRREERPRYYPEDDMPRRKYERSRTRSKSPGRDHMSSGRDTGEMLDVNPLRENLERR
ncbi:uncharacterized protein IAS62_003360 [Cryptococcus decagattii]|uniref:Multiple myeloma tumor-associated protein 2-like N-terminal domain-containing protein n=1 Tax=Cryptococcus decagattii TaxID=1859122 RepID=A0ABZ2AU21_9TREE